MDKLKQHFMTTYIGKANRDSVIQGDKYRFTVLTTGLIRMEYSEDGQFEDRPTQSVTNRQFDLVDYRLVDEEDRLEIITDRVHLYYNKKDFSPNNLYIDVFGQFTYHGSRWYYGQPCRTLGGTCRTLDNINGEAELEPGVLSKDGFSFFDDSKSLIVTDEGWVEPRRKDACDIYFFGYGRDYLECMSDFFKLCGHTPLIPRYALGNWWSRYWKYTEESLKELMTKFENKKMPFSVCVMDMDWHLVDIDPKYGSGWTGYTWNKDFFPDPQGMLDWLHEKDMQVTLNLHPASGVRAHEEMYGPMADALGYNRENEDPIPFEITDPKFMEAYFEYLHHPLEEQGVDFWWIDWQQGGVTAIEGLDPLWMLNHYHYYDINRKGKNDIIFSRYAGIGSHRYPIGFSGDTHATWESYAFQPYFTSTASNVGFCWWSHDIGGHMFGKKDDELATRWIQYGVFSPINRLHSSANTFMSKEPWNYGKVEEEIITRYLQLRHALVPYMYTMNYKLAEDGVPFIQPLYYQEPMKGESYSFPNEYYFGSELLVCPVTTPIDPVSKLAETKVWLPEGEWFDYFTGKHYSGNRQLNMYRGLDNQIVMAKAGAIIPLNKGAEHNNVDNPKELNLVVFAGANNQFDLIEDSFEKDHLEKAITPITYTCHGNEHKVHVKAVTGNRESIPTDREVSITLRGLATVEEININGEVYNTWTFDEETSAVVIKIEEYDSSKDYNVVVVGETILEVEQDYMDDVYTILNDARIEFTLKDQIYHLCKQTKNKYHLLSALQTIEFSESLRGALMEIIL